MASIQLNQNEAKSLFHGHRLLHGRRRFIGALVPEEPSDPAVRDRPSPPPSRGTGFPGHERASKELAGRLPRCSRRLYDRIP